MKTTWQERLQQIFDNPHGRILVESYSNSTVDWKVPDIKKLLGHKKVKVRSKQA